MTIQEIGKQLAAAGWRVAYHQTSTDPHLEIPRKSLVDVARKLQEDPNLAFDSLMCLSGLDWPEYLEVVYHLYSFKHRHSVTLKVRCPKDDAVVPSVSSIWGTAEWHEREAYDLIGMRFDGHPDHRRILLPDDWEGHPLRKDYQPPTAWHDIPLTTQLPTSTDEGN